MPQNLPRMSGVTIPLFSIRSRTDWGIGQISDLPLAAAWLEGAGQRLLQVLPTQTLAEGETSPYGALSAFAIDPIYIAIEQVPELDEGTLNAYLDEGNGERRALLDRVRRAPRVDYRVVRALKKGALARAFERFRTNDLATSSTRARAMLAFARAEGSWLPDAALYAALRDVHAGYGWSTWPERERDRSPDLVALARRAIDDAGAAPAMTHDGELEIRVLEQIYLQWIAHEQWAEARAKLASRNVLLMGDMPFVVGRESADVWAHREQFLSDVSVGAPPDDFAPEGQSWGLPPYDWKVMDADGLSWLRARARHAARLFDRFRIDHLVGFFRQWVSAPGERGHFIPTAQEAQIARGETSLRAFLDEATPFAIIAEDLGVIPAFVRETMAKLGVPGYKVIPWERDGNFMPFDPRSYPERSVATWSTHDTLPITAWWDKLEWWERERLAALRGMNVDTPRPERDYALFDLLFSARSELSLLLVTEVIGDGSRINTPGVVSDDNWTWRLPRPIEDLREDASLQERFSRIRQLVRGAGR